MQVIQWIVAFCAGWLTVLLIVVYGLALPNLVTNDSSSASSLIAEYYYGPEMWKWIVLDFILVAIYIGLAAIVIRTLKVNTFISKIAVVGITAIFLTTTAMFIVPHLAPRSFFDRWFSSVGMYAAAYDSILTMLVFIVMNGLYRRFSSLSQ